MKIRADLSLCIGSGQCVIVEPSLFAQHDDDLTVVVLQPDPPGELLAAAEEAVRMCPSHALSLAE
jgi:ferredoxin